MSRKKSGRTTGRINPVSPRLPSNSLGMKLFFALMVLLVLTLAVITVNPGKVNVLTGASVSLGRISNSDLEITLPDEVFKEIVLPEEPLPEEPDAEETPVGKTPAEQDSLPAIAEPVIVPDKKDTEKKTLKKQTDTMISNLIEIFALPTISSVILNTTDLTLNNSNQNITANVTSSDADGETVKYIYNWLVNSSSGPGIPIAILNMPFESVNGTNSSNAWDYSGYGNNVSYIGSIVWNATEGYGGRGAYTFDGVDDVLYLPDDKGLKNISYGNFTLAAWVKTNTSKTSQDIFRRDNYGDTIPDGQRRLVSLDLQFSTGPRFVLYDATNIPTAEGFREYRNNNWHHIAGVRDTAADVIH